MTRWAVVVVTDGNLVDETALFRERNLRPRAIRALRAVGSVRDRVRAFLGAR